MKRAAIISAILEDPAGSQKAFNDIVSAHNEMLRGRMGIPFGGGTLALISLTVVGTLDEINAFTGQLGKIPHVAVKVSVARECDVLE